MFRQKHLTFPKNSFQKESGKFHDQDPIFALLNEAVSLIKASKKPVIIAGGGVIYSEATEILKSLVEKTGIPVAETFAGKGSLPYNHPCNLGAVRCNRNTGCK